MAAVPHPPLFVAILLPRWGSAPCLLHPPTPGSSLPCCGARGCQCHRVPPAGGGDRGAPGVASARSRRGRPQLLGFAEHNGSEKAQSCWSKYIIVAGEINNKQRSDDEPVA